ncbi:hypothetical protein LF1_54710 [Rubripirellula obstinata]|uniref:Uncharacterized protein n=1 Tax=Rubripirellula obstinata TaxID=406547 RepID=A0A5B1CAN0_9BACT|nr:hypothetical protein LF1_54710 [Rubripirellula obstinata]
MHTVIRLNINEIAMKTPIAITLITCGTILMLSPAMINVLQHRQLSSTLQARPDFTNLSAAKLVAGEPMPAMFTFACVAIGIVMIGLSTYLSIRFPSPPESMRSTTEPIFSPSTDHPQ